MRSQVGRSKGQHTWQRLDVSGVVCQRRKNLCGRSVAKLLSVSHSRCPLNLGVTLKLQQGDVDMSDLIGSIANGLTVIAFAAAAVGTIQASRGRSWLLQWTLGSARTRSIGSALRGAGLNRIAVGRECRKLTKHLTRTGAASSVAAEIEWLTAVIKKSRPWWHGPLVETGVARKDSGADDGFERARSLFALSAAYDAFSRMLNAQAIMGSVALTKDLSVVASATSEYLGQSARFESHDLPRKITIRGHQLSIDLHSFHNSSGNGTFVDDVEVISRERLRYVDGILPAYVRDPNTFDDTRVHLTATELDALRGKFVGRIFDGLLPALENARIQRDPTSGRYRLSLTLSKRSYASVIVEHYPDSKGVGRSRAALSTDAEAEPRLLTLALLPITSDGYFMLATRSDEVAQGQGMISPAVCGNLPMRDRLGVVVDRDEFGFPDVLRSLCRETREEIGLEINRQRIEVTGVCRFSGTEEINTWLLLTRYRLPITVRDAMIRSYDADQAEGIWERAGLPIPVPTPKCHACANIIGRWTLHHPMHLPATVATVLSLCFSVILAGKQATANAADFIQAWIAHDIKDPLDVTMQTRLDQLLAVLQTPQHRFDPDLHVCSI